MFNFYVEYPRMDFTVYSPYINESLSGFLYSNMWDIGVDITFLFELDCYKVMRILPDEVGVLYDIVNVLLDDGILDYYDEFVLDKDDTYSARREFLNLRDLCIEASRVGTGLISFG